MEMLTGIKERILLSKPFESKVFSISRKNLAKNESDGKRVTYLKMYTL